VIMATVILLNQPPKWFSDIVIYSFYLAMFGWFAYNIVKGFRTARREAKQAEWEKQFKELINNLEEKGYKVKDVRW
jgi:SNF family Na+-dependent transporter